MYHGRMSTWELHDGRAQVGPVDEQHVLRMIAEGLPENTVVRQVGEADWRSLRSHARFAVALGQRAAPAPAMAPQGYPQPQAFGHPGYPQAPPLQARKVSKSSFIGLGCLVQGLGLIALFVIPAMFAPMGLGVVGVLVGLVVLLALMITGRRMSTEWSCGACATKLGGAEARICPACRANLT